MTPEIQTWAEFTKWIGQFPQRNLEPGPVNIPLASMQTKDGTPAQNDGATHYAHREFRSAEWTEAEAVQEFVNQLHPFMTDAGAAGVLWRVKPDLVSEKDFLHDRYRFGCYARGYALNKPVLLEAA